MAIGYWQGPNRRAALLLTLAFLAFVPIALGFQVAMTLWNRLFFNALENRDASAVIMAVQIILAITAAGALSGYTFNQVNFRLRLRWREWMTRHVLGQWMDGRRFHLVTIRPGAPSNPEYRIAEDIRIATENPTDIVYGLSSALLSAATFIGVLWWVGGSLPVDVLGLSFQVPGYMVIGVVLYTMMSTGLMAIIGRPLIERVKAKNAAEAEFRFEVTRVRENAEAIAVTGGIATEQRHLQQTLSGLAGAWIDMINRVSRMTGLTYANASLAPAIPLMLAAPKYLAGQLTLGEVMQLSSSFLIVHQALNWLADNSVRIAEWLASAERVLAFTEAVEQERLADTGKAQGRISVASGADDTIRVRGLNICDVAGAKLLDVADMTIGRGERVLIEGVSATGKSMLVRTLAGQWNWGSGRLELPPGARISFLLQRPYLPLGTLREALCYPQSGETIATDELQQALHRAELGYLAARLDSVEAWNIVLSGGEQQKLAFARLIASPPDIIVLDEATSALDEASEERMMSLLQSNLVNATVIGVGRRPQHERFFDRKIQLPARPSPPVAAVGGPRRRSPQGSA